MQSTEFLYPVDHVITSDGVKICVIHQKEDHLELWLWDPNTKEAVKGLLSSYTPAGLSVCPSRESFCFIDNDRLYIKSLIKKSPYAIDFMGPYELSRIIWIDDATFYFSAKERTHYNLFYGTINGSLCRLTYSKDHDYLYPQKKGGHIFFIERDATHTHRIKVADYPLYELKQHQRSWNKEISFEEKLHLIAQEEATATTECSFIDSSTMHELYAHKVPGRALSFLHMVSDTEGFFIEHAASITKKDLNVHFDYYGLVKKEGQWTTRLLFGFSIPIALLFSHGDSTRLYESMYPLLPRVTLTHIYYVSGNTDNLDLFEYERATGTSTQIEGTASDYYYFVPYIYNDKALCGGALARQSFLTNDEQTAHHLKKPILEMDDNSIHTMILPYFLTSTYQH